MKFIPDFFSDSLLSIHLIAISATVLKHKMIECLSCSFLKVLQWLLIANRVKYKVLSSVRL